MYKNTPVSRNTHKHERNNEEHANKQNEKTSKRQRIIILSYYIVSCVFHVFVCGVVLCCFVVWYTGNKLRHRKRKEKRQKRKE